MEWLKQTTAGTLNSTIRLEDLPPANLRHGRDPGAGVLPGWPGGADGGDSGGGGSAIP